MSVVRAIEARDRPALAALLTTVAEFTAEEVAVALELIDAAIDETDDYRVLVAESARPGALDGYVCFGPTPMTTGTWDLYWIATSSAARRTGVGRALIDALDLALRREGARLVRVETSSRDGYQATRSFYDRTGFGVAATIREFYAPGDDLVIYARYY